MGRARDKKHLTQYLLSNLYNTHLRALKLKEMVAVKWRPNDSLYGGLFCSLILYVARINY